MAHGLILPRRELLLCGAQPAPPAGVYFKAGDTGTGTGTTASLNLQSADTAGTEAVGYAPQTGDYVIICFAIGANGDKTFSLTSPTSVYTKLCDLFYLNTYGSQLAVFGGFYAGGRTITIEWDAVNLSYVWVSGYFGGVNATTPIGATTTTSGSASGGAPDSPSITTPTDNNMVLSIGATAGNTSNTGNIANIPSGMNDPVIRNFNTPRGIGLGSLLRATAGAYNPAAFGVTFTGSGQSACAATVCLKAA